MHFLGTRSFGRVILALAVAGSVFGIASVVQADIPDAGVIHGCYGKPGTPQRGELRVVDADQGEQCKAIENPLSWNQVGPTGQRGPTGPTGPGGVTGIGRNSFTGLLAGEYQANLDCTGFGLAEDFWVQTSVTTAMTQRDSYNVGEATTGTPDAHWVLHFNLAATTNAVIYGSCADPSDFGLAKPEGNAGGPPVVKLTKLG